MEHYPIFYNKVVPLDINHHFNLYIEPISEYRFTKNTNNLYITNIEFNKISKEYSIVFRKGADKVFFPIVVLGIRDNENLYVNAEGMWQAEYIPAYVRRYPFILSVDKTSKITNYTACIDQSYAGFNKTKEGQRLFTKGGNHTKFLKQSLSFLKEFQCQVETTHAFCEKLKKLNLFQNMQAEIKQSNGNVFTLGEFHVIDKDKLKTLSPETISELVRNEYMDLIFAHFASLNNIEELLLRLDHNNK